MENAIKLFALIKPLESLSLIKAYSPIAGCLLHLPVKAGIVLAASVKYGVFHVSQILRKNTSAEESRKSSV